MINFENYRSSFRGYTRTLRALVNYIDPHELYNDVRAVIYDILNTDIVLRLRLIICLSIVFSKWNEQGEETTCTFYFCSTAFRILSNLEIYPTIDAAFSKIFISIENFVRNGSGWQIKSISSIDLHLGQYRVFRGGCKNVCLPSKIKNKKAVLNIKCADNKCFLYSIAAKLYPSKFHGERAVKYRRYLKYFRIGNIKFPTPISKVAQFETLNNLRINVYGWEENEIFPMYVSKQTKEYTCIDLLYYEKHFFLIKNFNRLMNQKNGTHFYCRKCLSGFSRRDTLILHKVLCQEMKPQRVSMPKNTTLKFTNLAKMLYHPFCIFADFESLTKKVHTVLPSSSTSYSAIIERHEAISYTIIVTDVGDEIVFHEYFVGENVIQQFLDTLKYLSQKLLKKMRDIAPMIENPDSTYDSTICHICKQKFKLGEIRVRDHCHFGEGYIRGLGHQSCNLNYRATYFIPVIIHNARNYDTHLILKNLPADFAKIINIIPINMEKFTMFSLDALKFLDSYQFLDSSLDVLVNNLKTSNHAFKIFEKFFGNNRNKHLLKQKGIFPYSYFDSIDKLKEKQLPARAAFFNVLTNMPITETEYNHAQLVFQNFKCKTLADYLELYQNVDTIMLAEVFISFRRTAMQYYELDPVHFVTSAELTWNAGLKFTKVELQLLSNVNDYIWFESQMRGGICFLGKRYEKANNPYISDTYNDSKPHKYILALDANNLYGYVMSQSLPVGNFSWLTSEEIQNFNIFEYDENSDVGFILEVDMHCPENLHQKTNDLPFAVEHLKITFEMLSPYAKKLCERFNLKHTFPCKKLTPNFYPKKNYITHYLNLQFYIKEGMIVDKIHKILSFKQIPWLKDYIHFNNEKRKAATDEFTRSFCKKLNNSFFGRLMLNQRKKISVLGSVTEKDCKKNLSSPLLDYFEPVNENLTLFKMRKPNLILDKPIYGGFCILELSKLHMYKLYYSNFKNVYKSKCELLYMDTDSLYISVETDDVFLDMKTSLNNIFDLSNYPKNHFLFDDSNRGRLGYLKSEAVQPIREFVGLKAKMYAFSYGDTCKKTAKGVKKSSLKNFTFESYKNVLLEESSIRQPQCSIVSKKHELHTVIQNKIGLSAFYDKKYLADGGIYSLAYGHYQIENEDDDG
ncbi:hypothetical protein AVEN_87773-1 [Araneus ventricosus]|uniref:C2H2-type domain-containing protein n=1 Tax=Araneus ventricosus TaxID=182803 RepID=A0A4Y2L168_ARAVE|nr:hypothetical protein AVEN_87773-1 [Araneus ventricosus]